MADSKKRFERQIRCAAWGENGQSLFERAHAAVVGCGALGTVQSEALARAGIGTLTLVDRDFVEESNLHRQFLFDEQSALNALPKARAAEARLRQINSEVEVRAHVADLDSANVRELLDAADLILDATDNFETRYLLNDYALATNKPWIYGAAVGTYGLTATVIPFETPCLRCLYPDPPEGARPTCETAGVLAPITMQVASVQVTEAMKILSGNVQAARRGIWRSDIWSGETRVTEPVGRDPECPACARREWTWLAGERRPPVSLCGRNAVQIHERRRTINLEALHRELAELGTVRSNGFALRFFPEPYELTVFPDGRAIVKGTTDPAVARGVYARYLGI